MLQNNMINGIHVNGNSSNGSELTVVAGHGLDVRMRHDLGKPLSQTVVPCGRRRSERLSGHAFAVEGCSTEPYARPHRPKQPAAAATAWTPPGTLLEPPAAAWAALVLSRAISV